MLIIELFVHLCFEYQWCFSVFQSHSQPPPLLHHLVSMGGVNDAIIILSASVINLLRYCVYCAMFVLV